MTTTTRPRGRAPNGDNGIPMVWCEVVGKYIENDNDSEEEVQKKTTKTNSGRPRGRAPKGMEWDIENQMWVPNGEPLKVNSTRPRGRAPKDEYGMPKVWDESTQQWVEDDCQYGI